MKKKILFTFIFFALFWLALLGLSGSLQSGFHFTDDHQIINFSSQPDFDIIDTAIGYISGDIHNKGRFFPLYNVHRLIQVKVFGTDFFLWAMYDWLLATIASSCFAVFMLLAGYSLLEALFFPLLLFLGFQTGIWWRFGTAETIAMPLVSFMLVVSALSAKRPGLVLDVLFVILGALVIFSKEAFILFVPAIVFLRIWTHQMINQTGWPQAIKRSLIPGIVLLFLVAADLAFIVFYVGTTGMGYAGYEGFNIGPFLSATMNYLIASHAWLIPAGFFLFAAAKPSGRSYGDLVPLAIFFCLALLPQALLHAKSGVSERYLIPGVFGSVFAIIHLMRKVRASQFAGAKGLSWRWAAGWAAALSFMILGAYLLRSPKLAITFTPENLLLLSEVEQVPLASYFTAWLHGAVRLVFPWGAAILALVSVFAVRSGVLSRILNRSLFLALSVALVLLLSLSISFDNAFHSAFQGRMTNQWLKSIEENTLAADAILVVADPALNHEWSLSMKSYLSQKSGRKNLYAYPVYTRPSYTPFEKTLISSFGSIYERDISAVPDVSAIKAIAIFPDAEEAFLASSTGWFDPAAYSRYVNMYGFTSYYRVR